MNARSLWWLAGIAALAAAPLAIQHNRYWVTLAIVGCIYAVFACGQTLLLGYAGQVSLGHAALYGVGAYTSAILTSRYDVPFVIGLVAAGVLAAAVAYLLGRPLLHLEPFYLAMATLVLGLAATEIFHSWSSMTGGTTGVIGIPRAALGPFRLDTPLRYLYFVLAIAVIVLVLAGRLARGFVGRAFRAIKSDETAAIAAGIDIRGFKTKVFALSGALAGLAGAMYAHHARYISPETFNVNLSILVVVMAVVGGSNHVAGAAIGAVFMTGFPEITRSYGEWRDLIYGIVLFLTLVLLPGGIAGGAQSLWGRLTGRWRSRPATPDRPPAPTGAHPA